MNIQDELKSCIMAPGGLSVIDIGLLMIYKLLVGKFTGEKEFPE